MAAHNQKFAFDYKNPFYDSCMPLGLPQAEAAILKGIEAGLTDPSTLDRWYESLRTKVNALRSAMRKSKKETKDNSSHAETKAKKDKVPTQTSVKPSVSAFAKFLSHVGGVKKDLITSIKKFDDIKSFLTQNPDKGRKWSEEELKLITNDDNTIVRDKLVARLTEHFHMTQEELRSTQGWYPYFFSERKQQPKREEVSDPDEPDSPEPKGEQKQKASEKEPKQTAKESKKDTKPMPAEREEEKKEKKIPSSIPPPQPSSEDDSAWEPSPQTLVHPSFLAGLMDFQNMAKSADMRTLSSVDRKDFVDLFSTFARQIVTWRTPETPDVKVLSAKFVSQGMAKAKLTEADKENYAIIMLAAWHIYNIATNQTGYPAQLTAQINDIIVATVIKQARMLHDDGFDSDPKRIGLFLVAAVFSSIYDKKSLLALLITENKHDPDLWKALNDMQACKVTRRDDQAAYITAIVEIEDQVSFNIHCN